MDYLYPDGGYGWVVVGCSFTLCVILGGVVSTTGFFLVEWVIHFDVDKALVVWIGAVQFSVGALLLSKCENARHK